MTSIRCKTCKEKWTNELDAERCCDPSWEFVWIHDRYPLMDLELSKFDSGTVRDCFPVGLEGWQRVEIAEPAKTNGVGRDQMNSTGETTVAL